MEYVQLIVSLIGMLSMICAFILIILPTVEESKRMSEEAKKRRNEAELAKALFKLREV